MVGDWLLCDFHIHTTLSDGKLALNEVVDLYGKKDFDVINISDHVLDEKSMEHCLRENIDTKVVVRDKFAEYQELLWKEGRRAWEKYQMILIPGSEITNNSDGYHILGIDIKNYIDPSLNVEDIVNRIHAQNGIAVAPHPHRGSVDGSGQLMHLWDNHEKYLPLFDAWEVANRDDLFNVIGLKKFNYIANSDFHESRHLYSWKTLLRCEKNTEAVKQAIRENSGVSIYLFREDKTLKK